MKAIDYHLRYDGATAAEVYAMLGQQEFREQVCDYQGVIRRTVTVDVHDTGMDVHLDQAQATHRIPSFARKFVGDEINYVQDEAWSSPTAATVNVVIPGKPGEMKGTIRITEDATGTTQSVLMEVRIGIPLVGGKIEGLVAEMLTKALRAENEVGHRWLAS